MKLSYRQGLNALLVLALVLTTAGYGHSNPGHSAATENGNRLPQQQTARNGRDNRGHNNSGRGNDPPCRRGKNASRSKPCNGQPHKEDPSDCDCGKGNDDDKSRRSRRSHRN